MEYIDLLFSLKSIPMATCITLVYLAHDMQIFLRLCFVGILSTEIAIILHSAFWYSLQTLRTLTVVGHVLYCGITLFVVGFLIYCYAPDVVIGSKSSLGVSICKHRWELHSRTKLCMLLCTFDAICHITLCILHTLHHQGNRNG